MVIKMKEFLQHIREELGRITWPTNKEMKLHTTQVFVFMLIMTLFFAAVDGIISLGLALPAETDDVYEELAEDDYPDLDELLDEDDEDEDENNDNDDEYSGNGEDEDDVED